MKLKIYQVDAFANEVFSGNPAAVCPLEKWPDDKVLQKIAAENNLAETAFYVPENDFYQIRWFTPTVEVDLCGHATLATAFVLFNFENHTGNTLIFKSRKSGVLSVTKNKDLYSMDFPLDHLEPVEITKEIISGFNHTPYLAFKGKTDYLFIYKNEEEIKNLSPDFNKVIQLEARGVITSAPGESSDFVSRFFAPRIGVNEDPVTGSTHTTLIPYWANVLQKKELTARQLSARSGYLTCKLTTNRVEISGECKLYLKGEIYI